MTGSIPDTEALGPTITEYPAFSALALGQRPLLHPHFQRLPEGMSELTFAGIYLFRQTHRYRVSRLDEERFVIAGQDAEAFFMLPFGLPKQGLLNSLFERHGVMKAVSPAQAEQLSRMGYRVWEDRDNFDYLYRRESLARLAGRPLHRKKNLVNLFRRSNACVARPLLEGFVGDALQVLERWKQQQQCPVPAPSAGSDEPASDAQAPTESRTDAGDYAAAREALENMEYLQLCGGVFYVEDEPVAYTLGRMFVIHFEKAVRRPAFRGIYQYVNQAFAAALPEQYETINREQDLGDPGLRQAKESYKPIGFVTKYRAAL
jgi:hypothetical protein